MRRAGARRHQKARQDPPRRRLEAHGRGSAQDKAKHKVRVGYDFVHSAVDDHSRLAYSEVLPNERKETCTAFWSRAHAFFTAHNITVERVLTDNGMGYRSHAWRDLLISQNITHKRTRPYRPQTNCEAAQVLLRAV